MMPVQRKVCSATLSFLKKEEIARLASIAQANVSFLLLSQFQSEEGQKFADEKAI